MYFYNTHEYSLTYDNDGLVNICEILSKSNSNCKVVKITFDDNSCAIIPDSYKVVLNCGTPISPIDLKMGDGLRSTYFKEFYFNNSSKQYVQLQSNATDHADDCICKSYA